MPELKSVYGRYKSQGLALIGIHSDPDIKKRDAVVKEKGLPYYVCNDIKDSTQTLYNIQGYPTIIVIDRKGIVRAIDPDDLDKTLKALLAQH
jgi:hypothetical protein